MKLHIILLAAPALARTLDAVDSAAPGDVLDHPGAGPHGGYHGFGPGKAPPHSKAGDGDHGGVADHPTPTGQHKGGKAAGKPGAGASGNPFAAWGPAAAAAAAAAASMLGVGANGAGGWPTGGSGGAPASWPTGWPAAGYEGKSEWTAPGEWKKDGGGGSKGKKGPGKGSGGEGKGWHKGGVAAPTWTTAAGPLETFVTATLVTATIRDGASVQVTSTTVVASHVGKAGPGS
jgi:hypothetical protein